MINSKSLFLAVVIHKRDGIFYQGEAKALTSKNDKGVFDILPMHANFIAIIKDYIRVYKKEGGQELFKITMGVMSVAENQVRIYLDIFTPVDIIGGHNII
jgi:F0F1-type ATP synthase epsilon subunit